MMKQQQYSQERGASATQLQNQMQLMQNATAQGMMLNSATNGQISTAQLQDNVANNLKSYIQDLKKVASNNKQKRGNGGGHQGSHSYIRQAQQQVGNYPQTTKNNGNIQMMFMNNPLGMSQNIIQSQNNQNLNQSAMHGNPSKILLQNEQELMMMNQTQILSPTALQPASRGKMSQSSNVTPNNRRQNNNILSSNQNQNQNNSNNINNTGSRGNILSNKALAYLNSKKATSILKSYEEAISSSKFIQNHGSKIGGSNNQANKNSSSTNISFVGGANERGRSQQKSRGGMRNHQEMIVQSEDPQAFMNNTGLYSSSNMMSPANITQQINPQAFTNMKNFLENNFNQTQQLSQNLNMTQVTSQQQQRPQQKEVIIRKQSSKSLLKNANNSSNMVELSQGTQKRQQSNHQLIQQNTKPSHQRVLSQVTTNRQDLIITDSTAAQITNDTASMTRHIDQQHHYNNSKINNRKIGSHNFIMKVNQQNSEGGSYVVQDENGNDSTTNQQRALMKKIHTLGNSLGAHKKSLNISQQFGDSINDLTLAKTGKMNNFNLSSLLKSHLLDDDGIEDLHFYFVSFNQHKKGILQQHEIIASKLQLSNDCNPNGKVQIKTNKKATSGTVNLKSKKGDSQTDNNLKDKTIESIEEEDLF
eukprot:403374884